MKENFYPALVENEFYHIYNRGNNRETIFYNHENYLYFLRKFDEYLSPYIETYAYCLLPNHFHLLVRVKSSEDVVTAVERIPSLSRYRQGGMESLVSSIISEQFRRFFISYSQSINKQESRVGSLFQKNFKRKHIDSESYFTSVVHYIHANPQLHGICEDYKLYPHSSYGRILIDKPTKLMKNEILEWFGGKEGFLKFHEVDSVDLKVKNRYEIEDTATP